MFWSYMDPITTYIRRYMLYSHSHIPCSLPFSLPLFLSIYNFLYTVSFVRIYKFSVHLHIFSYYLIFSYNPLHSTSLCATNCLSSTQLNTITLFTTPFFFLLVSRIILTNVLDEEEGDSAAREAPGQGLQEPWGPYVPTA